jgi:hypothetical protein
MSDYILGGRQSGQIFDKFKELGVHHDNYQIPEQYKRYSVPTKYNQETHIVEIEPGHNIDGGTYLGGGAENNVYDHGEYVMKYPKGGNSISYSSGMKTKTSDLDLLIHQYEKILSIRVFQCVINTAHQNFLYMNPDKVSEVPFVQTLNSVVTKIGAIKEDKVQDRSNPVKSIATEVAKFVPKIVKELFFYFDRMGGIQAYQNGKTEDGRPIYNIVDGVDVYSKSVYTPEELLNKPQYTRDRFFNKEKELQRVKKFQEMIKKCSEKETQKILQEIEHTFKTRTTHAMTKLAHEYWFHNKQIEFADGDIGDKNHQIIAEDYILNHYIPRPPEHLETLSKGTLNQASAYDETFLQYLMDKYKYDRDYAQSNAYFGNYLRWLMTGDDESEAPVVHEVLSALKDPRKYAVENLGWIRVQDDSIETYNLDQSHLDEIMTGLYELYGDVVYNMKFNFETHSPRKYFENVSFAEIESGSIRKRLKEQISDTPKTKQRKIFSPYKSVGD